MATELDVLLLAAGFGTRLRPLTEQIPKALLPIYGEPLLDLHLARLLGPGGRAPAEVAKDAPAVRARRVVVNAHHLAEAVRSHLETHPLRDRIVLSHEPEILGTGGAIAKAAPHLESDPFAVMNADALFAPPLEEAVAFHRSRGFAATLVLIRSPAHPNVRVDGERVSEIRPGHAPGALTFTGFQIVSQEFARLLPAGVFHDVRETYGRLIGERRLGAFVHEPAGGAAFMDIGTPASYLEAHRLCAGAAGGRFGVRPAMGARPAEGFGFIDGAARVAEGAVVRESIVLARAEIAPGVRVERSVVGPGARITADAAGLLVTTLGTREIAPAAGAGTPEAR